MNSNITAEPKNPNEIPVPGKTPETIPTEEKGREITPCKKPLTVPPSEITRPELRF